MGWSLTQRKRLAFENSIIKAYFHSDEVEWIDRNDDTKLEIFVTCSSNSNYTLRIYLPSDFPNSCPAMVVRSSSGLLRRKNVTFLEQRMMATHKSAPSFVARGKVIKHYLT